MKRTILITYSILLFLGVVFPFIPMLDIMGILFALLAFVITLPVFIFFFVFSFFSDSIDRNNTVFMFTIIPIFVLAELGSVYTIDAVQLYRSKNSIQEIETIRTNTGELPKKMEIAFGIEYVKHINSENYYLRYSEGFLEVAEYDSATGKWTSLGWND